MPARASFYVLIPHAVMAGGFGAVGLVVLLALGMGFRRFWADIGARTGELARPGAVGAAVMDVLTLRYLDGGAGDGCTYPQEAPSQARRICHHLAFYGFLLCFAATSVATIDHYVFGWEAPYPWTSLPVLLGTAGGIGLLAGPAGLLWLKRRADPAVADPRAAMGSAFSLLLMLTSLTGLLLLALRATPAMGALLAVHLGVVLGLFVTLPYGKLVHAVYRFAALIRYRLERAQTGDGADHASGEGGGQA